MLRRSLSVWDGFLALLVFLRPRDGDRSGVEQGFDMRRLIIWVHCNILVRNCGESTVGCSFFWHLAPPCPRTQSPPLSAARVSCHGRPRLPARRTGRSTGSTSAHCSSFSSGLPVTVLRCFAVVRQQPKDHRIARKVEGLKRSIWSLPRQIPTVLSRAQLDTSRLPNRGSVSRIIPSSYGMGC
jgi:hypothetical protein